jgi:AcrR family transcriptional regulator
MPRPRAQDYELKRRAILRRAAALFARLGYTAASIAIIARSCGMSKALLYHYYPDKEALLDDIIRENLLALIRVVECAAAADLAPRERFHALAVALLDAYRDADDAHQVQLNGLKLLPEPKQASLKALERRLVALFAETLAQALPDLAADRRLLMPLTMSAFGMLNWHYLWFREGRGLTRAQYAHLVAELVLSGAAGAVAALPAQDHAG